MTSRRTAFALAAVLAATAVTGGVAVSGLARSAQHPASPPAAPVVQSITPAPPATRPAEEQD
jgi:hypothetical protein